MRSKVFLRIVQVSGVVLFAVVVVITMLFIEGYQFDPAALRLVKKSVIYFDAPFAATETPPRILALDGQERKFKFPGELRVLPGQHEIEIRQAGYRTFYKKLDVKEDAFIRFPEILLLPDVPPKPILLDSNKGYVIGSVDYENALVVKKTLHFGKLINLDSSASRPVIFELPLDFSFKKLSQSFSSTEMAGIDMRGKFFFYDLEKHIKKEVPGIAAVDFFREGDALFVLDKTGKLFVFSDSEKAPDMFADLALPFGKIVLLTRVSGLTHVLAESSGRRDVFLFGSDGDVIVHERNIESSYIEDSRLYYIRGGERYVFDIKKEKVADSKKIKKEIIWFSRIGTTFNFLLLTRQKNIHYCDEDFENCYDIGVLDEPFMQASKDKTLFFGVANGNFIMFDFAPESFVRHFLDRLVSGV